MPNWEVQTAKPKTAHVEDGWKMGAYMKSSQVAFNKQVTIAPDAKWYKMNNKKHENLANVGPTVEANLIKYKKDDDSKY